MASSWKLKQPLSLGMKGKKKQQTQGAGVSTSEGARKIKAVIKHCNLTKWLLALSGVQHGLKGVCVFKESEFSLALYRK